MQAIKKFTRLENKVLLEEEMELEKSVIIKKLFYF